MQSHAPQHANARHSCWGPLRVVSKLRTTKRHGFRRDLTRLGAVTTNAEIKFSAAPPCSAYSTPKTVAQKPLIASPCGARTDCEKIDEKSRIFGV